MDYLELKNEQRRQLIDTRQTYAALRPALLELDRLGTMRAQSSKGRKYMYAAWSTVRKSLGRVTPQLIKQKAAHDARRQELLARIKGTRGRLDELAPVNRALNLNRVPDIAARIITLLDREGLLGSHVIVAGTNALFAYEVACGVQIGQDHVATTDADLIWDPQQSLLLAATGVRREGLMGVLRKVDKSFIADFGFNATNRDGYIVDLLCPDDSDNFTTMNAGADLEATPMAGIRWLLNAPQFEEVVIGEDGQPFRIVVPDPRTFALHKLWVSEEESRSALKRPRDREHARIVAHLTTKYLGKKLVGKDMPWLSPRLRTMMPILKEML